MPSFLGMTLENQSWNSFGERGQRGRARTSTIKNSHGSIVGFLKKLFLEVHPSLDPLTPSLTLDSLHLFIQNSFLSTYCVHTVCVYIARPPVGSQQSLFSIVPMQKNLHPETCLQQSKSQIAHSFSG